MIHYHGLPITPATAAMEAISGGHAFVSFAHPGQIGLAMEACQSFAIDNGAFSAWRSGKPVRDWTPFYEWVGGMTRHPAFDWAVIPDVIDGDEAANDRLVDACPLAPHLSVPVWHMHESTTRLQRLCTTFPRVAIGSSGSFATVGNASWWHRIHEAMSLICDEHGLPPAKLHGLRMLNPAVFTKLPFASADSTNIGQNVGIDSRWKGTYTPANKEARARLMRSRIEAFQSAQQWRDPLFS